MKQSSMLVVKAVLCISGTTLEAKDPVLTTPGTAVWTNEITATGTKTVFTLSSNTVLSWDQLALDKGSEIDFNFVGGNTVVNFLGGDGFHYINGAITSNGIVAFFSPTADLEVNGSIIAKGVTLATANADASSFSSGGDYEMSASGGFNFLTVNGLVDATGGDVVLGGERIVVGDAGKIQASRDALIGAGKNVTVAASGENRIKETSSRGYVLLTGEARASRVEVAAGQEIRNQGSLDAGRGKIYLSVGEGGQITNESTGIIAGDLFATGALVSNGQILIPDDGDSVPSVNASSLTIPKLSRPDGSQVTTIRSQTNTGTKVVANNQEAASLSYHVPMSASGDAKRDTGRMAPNNQQVAKNESSTSLLQRSSFFGLRGGTTGKPVAAKR